ncbi:hypothetical protein BG003_006655 [Podila horticola]|nr:hypothetical protein BG003_006655 [Podila horticola]
MHADDKKKAHYALFAHFKKLVTPRAWCSMWTARLHSRRGRSIRSASRVMEGKSPTSQIFMNVEKDLRGGFKWSYDDRVDFVQYLWTSIRLASCRQVDEIQVLKYNKMAVLVKARRTAGSKLTALACMGIATNYGIVKNLPDANVSELIKSYLNNPLVVRNNTDDIDFTVSILVFTSMMQESTGLSSISTNLSSSQPATHMAASSASSLSYDALYREATVGEDKPAQQGQGKEFRRHRVIDKPAHQPGVHQQEHRPRYSYKECPEPLEHDPPSIRKPYKWKPYTKEQEARWRASM